MGDKLVDRRKIKEEKVFYKDITISSGTTTDEIDLKGGTLVGVLTPASIASSSMTITAAKESGGTFLTVNTSSAAYSVTIAQNGWYQIDPSVTAGLRFIKLVMGSSETSKTYTIVYRTID